MDSRRPPTISVVQASTLGRALGRHQGQDTGSPALWGPQVGSERTDAWGRVGELGQAHRPAGAPGAAPQICPRESVPRLWLWPPQEGEGLGLARKLRTACPWAMAGLVLSSSLALWWGWAGPGAWPPEKLPSSLLLLQASLSWTLEERTAHLAEGRGHGILPS